MKVEVKLTKKDILVAQFIFFFKTQIRRIPLLVYLFLFHFSLLAIISFFRVEKDGFLAWITFSFTGAIIHSLITLLSILLGPQVALFFYFKNNKGYADKQKFSIEEDGLREETKKHISFVKWRDVRVIHKDRQYLLVKIDELRVHVIPGRYFISPEAFNQFYKLLLARSS